MCGNEECPNFHGGWTGEQGSRNQGRFRGIRKRLSQSKQDSAFVDGKSLCFECFEVVWKFAFFS